MNTIHHNGTRSLVVDISFPEIEKFDRLPEPRAEGPTAFISIMEEAATNTVVSGHHF